MNKRIEKLLSKEFITAFLNYEFEEKNKYEIIYYIIFESHKEPEESLEELLDCCKMVIHEETDMIEILRNMLVNLIIQTYEAYRENQIIENLLV